MSTRARRLEDTLLGAIDNRRKKAKSKGQAPRTTPAAPTNSVRRGMRLAYDVVTDGPIVTPTAKEVDATVETAASTPARRSVRG